MAPKQADIFLDVDESVVVDSPPESSGDSESAGSTFVSSATAAPPITTMETPGNAKPPSRKRRKPTTETITKYESEDIDPDIIANVAEQQKQMAALFSVLASTKPSAFVLKNSYYPS